MKTIRTFEEIKYIKNEKNIKLKISIQNVIIKFNIFLSID